jgi:hypothetical protein
MPHKTKKARREYQRRYSATHPVQLAKNQKKYRGTGGYFYGTALFALAAGLEHTGHPYGSLALAVIAVYALGSLLKEMIC